MIILPDDNKCCGCGVCKLICPRNAIKMESNIEGFLIPVLDQKRCITCGLCIIHCPVKKVQLPRKPLRCFAAKVADEQVRKKSSSGGVFTKLSESVLARQGIVFGAAWVSAEQQVKHIAVDSFADLHLLQGSKYVQSDLGDTFYATKVALGNGQMVLFSGTPCQIAGLRSYLKKDYSHLICVEVICHAVPSPLILQCYLDKHRRKQGSDIVNVSFRNKKYGWRSYSIAIKYENSFTEYNIQTKDEFMQSFLHELCNRKSCHDCVFRQGKSGADITLGDYWGIKNKYPDLDDNMGVSLILAYSTKGVSALNEISDCFSALRDVSYEDALQSTRAIIESPQIHPCRLKFFQYAMKYGIKKAVFKILAPPFPRRIYYTMRSIAKKIYLRLK